MSERDKFLTEAMGECWHDWMEDLDEYTDYTCTKCNKQEFNLKWDNFSTWEGFGKLWEWSQKQDWFDAFVASLTDARLSMVLHKKYINPNNFADAIYEFLKEKETQCKN